MCAAPHPSLALTGQRIHVEPDLCIGRHEGTDTFRGRSTSGLSIAAVVAPAAIEPQYVCGAATLGGTRAPQSRQNTRPSADWARNPKAEKKAKKSAQRGS